MKEIRVAIDRPQRWLDQPATWATYMVASELVVVAGLLAILVA